MLDEVFLHLNSHEEMSRLTSLVTGKSTIWEVVGILRKTQLQHTLFSLNLNFKYNKFQGQLNTLYARYKSRKDTTPSQLPF